MDLFDQFADENEVSHRRLSDREIALAVQSKYNRLTTVFHLNEQQFSYEHLTPVVVDVPPNKRKAMAEAAISKAYKEISPVLPPDDDRLFVYGSVRGLEGRSDNEIREGILDAMGRVAGYDNEKHPIFRHIVAGE